MQRPNTIYYWSSPLLESSCTPATPSLRAILGKIAINQLKMIDKFTFYNSNNALEPTSLVICNGIVELVQVLRKLEKPKYSIFNFLLLYFWQKVNLQLLFIADLKHKCVDEEHKKTKPGRQAGAFLHYCYSWKMSKRTWQLCSIGDCDVW